jgi:hypothetical protein
MRNKLLAALASLAAVFAMTLSAPAVASGNSGDASCTSGTYTGDTAQGTWQRTYNPSCAGSTTGTVTISWNNYTGSDGAHHIVWQATVQAGPIYSNDCIEVALDWQNPQGGHSDAQFARNCFEGSTYTTTKQDLRTNGYSGGSIWYVKRLQIAVYNGSTGNVSNVVCPGNNFNNVPSDTATDAGCTDWLHLGAAGWSSVGAKIYRRDNSGNDNNNDPFYGVGGTYTINNQVSATS